MDETEKKAMQLDPQVLTVNTGTGMARKLILPQRASTRIGGTDNLARAMEQYLSEPWASAVADTGQNPTKSETIPARQAYRATVAVYHEPPKRAGGFSMPAATFGIALEHPSGHVEELWGTTYAPEPVAPTVLAITMILEEVPASAVVEIYTLAEFRRYVEVPGEIIRNAISRSGYAKYSGKKLNPAKEMREVLSALDAGRWVLRTYDDPRTAPHYYSVAAPLARGVAWRAALSHKAEFAPTSLDYPQCSIVQRSK